MQIRSAFVSAMSKHHVCWRYGPLHHYFAIVELDIDSIRDFHSHELPPLGSGAKFKPTPEGFEISKPRKQIPGT